MRRVWNRGRQTRRVVGSLLAVLGIIGGGAAVVAQAPPDFAPASGGAQVVAQGVVALPEEEVVWRAVRGRAAGAAEAPFVERPLGFVLATGEPILLVDGATGAQTRLGTGEAALTAPGTEQQRAAFQGERAGYLALELVPAADPPAAAGETVLQTGEPFQPEPGLHDLDLVRGVLTGEETSTVPDSGAGNAILVTDGAATVAGAAGEPATLLAGELATFDGELVVGVAGAGGAPGADDQTTFVVAIIGPAVAPVAIETPTPTPLPTPAAEPTPAAAEPTPAAAEPTPAAAEPTPEAAEPTAEPEAAESGTIAVQVYTCPAGMRPETLAAAACSPASGDDYDVTLAGGELEAPLTLLDATAEDGTYTWDGLPFGRYRLAQAIPPAGYDTYVVSAANATGDSETGYLVPLEAETPEVRVRIYNFPPAPGEGTPEAGGASGHPPDHVRT